MRAGPGILLGLSGVAAGVVVALVALTVAAPAEVVPGEAWFPVVLEEFADSRGISASLEVPDPQVLVVGASGRVTASSCTAGGTVASGSVVAAVDGAPVVALATTVPLWRDLFTGARGDDVAALQRELNRLGEALTVDGRFGAGTAAAVDRVWGRGGAGDPDGVVSVGHTMWLPAASVTVGTCEVLVGQWVDGSGPFATVARTATAVRLGSLPADVVGGARTVSYGGVTVPVEEPSLITSPEMMAAMMASDTFRVWSVDPGLVSLTFTVDYALADPVMVAVVPPAAVGGTGGPVCVQARDGTVPVRVVASQLGRTFVMFDGATPAEVRVPAAGERIECG